MVALISVQNCGGGAGDTGRPYELTVGGPTPVLITPDGYQQYDFTLLRAGCTMSGRIAALAAGDLDAVVLDNAGFRRWPKHRDTQGLWRADRVAGATVKARFGEPGLYHLVVSSTFARLTSKAIAVSVHAQVDCP